MPDVTTDGRRCEVVETGQPATRLIACTRCGVLLWDVDKHYREAHGIACVVDDCPTGPFSSTAELNAHSREHHVQESRMANTDLIVRRYPGADQAGDFTWHKLPT